MKTVHTLTASAAAALLAGFLALPASAQTATTPTDNGADCANANQTNCVNNNSSSVSQPVQGVDSQDESVAPDTNGGSNPNTVNNNTGAVNGNTQNAPAGQETNGGKGGLSGTDNTN